MPKQYLPHLPVHTVLPELRSALKNSSAILAGPPGSGKTTVVPIQLINEPWLANKKILLLEPRRIAAKAAAAYMSRLLGEPVGTTVGYRIRFEQKVSKATRIEVVTEGILTRQIQNDPELTGVGLVIFDEFHERSLQADLGLALCLDLLELRDDLRLLVMSATLDVAPLTTLMNNVPVITAEGKSYPVDINYLQRQDDRSIAMVTAAGIRRAWQEQEGDILAFLPGAYEIKTTANLLDEQPLPDTTILPLFGQLPARQQQLIFHPDPSGNRRVILATSIAETSLTIEGISAVVDSGWSRLPAFDPGSGLSRLKTVRVSQATMKQRQGRAGRLGPGVCYRLWTTAMEHNFPEFHPPEIRDADLSRLVLELALWGVKNPDELQWLDPPSPGHWQVAKELLLSLSAIDPKGVITPKGRELVDLPVHPRLAHMIMEARELGLGSLGCDLAALLSERDILRGKQPNADIRERLLLLRQDRRSRKPTGVIARILRQSEALAKTCGITRGKDMVDSAGFILSFAYPDRIGKLRASTRNRYLLTGGRGAILAPTDLLCGEQYLVTPVIHADQAEARIHLAAPLSIDEILTHHANTIKEEEEVFWDGSGKKVSAYKRTRLGRIILSQSQLQNPPADKVEEALCQGIKSLGLSCLGWNKKDRTLQNRLLLLHRELGSPWPDVGDDLLLADMSWLVPYLTNITKIEQLAGLDIHSILLTTLPWKQQQELDRLAPTHIRVPSGSNIRLVYEADGSVILPVRLQEMFGQQETPTLCNGKVLITVHLLSPARRPLQVTEDLVSFWKNGYPLVKKEMAGRYPKHYWPDDPIKATATSGTKKSMRSKKI